MDETRDARKYQTIRPQGTIAVKLSNNLLKPTTTFLVGLMLEKAVSYRQMQFFIHNLQCCCCRTRTNSGAYMLQFMSFRNCMTRYSYLLVVQRSPWSELHNFQNRKGELHQPRKASWNIISYRLPQYIPNHLTTESQLWPMTSARGPQRHAPTICWPSDIKLKPHCLHNSQHCMTGLMALLVASCQLVRVIDNTRKVKDHFSSPTGYTFDSKP
jgi:hypothetical protein